ncbi:hypothetical protein DRJ25_02135 [Candidatus Woesearchaeota archaeon]|nr:MAG: hypothetical protein DRJ25_02135 [Candidatus Woesearchaeota archaeon]
MAKNKILIGILIGLLVIISAIAAEQNLCTDSDNGPEGGRHPSADVLKTKGSTKYGILAKEDICVISKKEDLQTSESFYLKEYFCDNDMRQSRIFDCRDYGFEKCVDGACVGEGTNVKTHHEDEGPSSHCGDRLVEKSEGEECDPPGSVCLEGDNYGMCQKDCKCKWHNPPAETEQEDSEPESAPAENSEKQDSESKSETETTAQKEDNESGEEKEEKYPLPNVTIPEVGEPKNFSQEPGIEVTRGIAGFFKKMWHWFLSLF